MMTNVATPSLAERLSIPLDGMRATMAAQGPRKGPAAALQRAILRLLEALMALLAEFKAGTIGAVPGRDAASATCAANAPCAASATCAEPDAAGSVSLRFSIDMPCGRSRRPRCLARPVVPCC
jgi:hypothetical protein